MTPYGRAFAAARKAGKKYFMFGGIRHTTELASERKAPTRVGYNNQFPDKSEELRQQEISDRKKYADRQIELEKEYQDKIRKSQSTTGKISKQTLDRLNFEKLNKQSSLDYMRQQSEFDRMLLPGVSVGPDGVTTTNLHELYVNAPRMRIDPNNKKTMTGLLPVTDKDKNGKITKTYDRLYQDYNTGQFYLTDNHGNIIASTMSEDVAKKDNGRYMPAYRGMTEREASRQAHISDAQDQVNKHSARVGNGVTKEQLITDINNARGAFVNAVNGVVNANHLITGGLKMTFSPDYTWQDYKNGIVNFDINNQMIGAGDLLGVENPYANFLLNMINPTSMLISSGNSNLSRMDFKRKQLEPGKMQVKVANEPEVHFQTGKGKGVSHNRPVKGSKGGWRSDNKGTSVYNHGAGSGSHLETKEFQYGTVVPVYTPGKTPTMYYRTAYDNYEAPSLDVIDTGHVETPYVSPYQQQLNMTGEWPASSAIRWNSTPREGVYNTDNTYWRGLSGEGRRYSSALSNTYNNGQGFTVGYRKGGRVKKFKFI